MIMLVSFFYFETNSPWFSCCFPNHVVLLSLAAMLSFKADRYCAWVGNMASWESSVLCLCLESLIRRQASEMSHIIEKWLRENKLLLRFCSWKPAERNSFIDKDGDMAFVTAFNGTFKLTISVFCGKNHLILFRLS